jgi:hypothetical protein
MGLKVRELATKLATKSAPIVNSLIKSTPMLDSIPFIQSTKGTNHAYEELSDVTAPSFVNFDGNLPMVDSQTIVREMALNVIGGRIEAGEVALNKLGMNMSQYVASKMEWITGKYLMDVEGFVIGLLKSYAIANGKAWSAVSTDTDANKYNTIIGVRWQDGNMCGVYDPTGFGNGMMFDLEAKWKGGLGTITDGKDGYAVRLLNYLGFLTANKDNIAIITNVPSTAPADTLKLLLDGIGDECKEGLVGDSYLYMPRKIKTRIAGKFKDSMATGADPMDINRKADYWNTLPMIGSYNFVADGEAYVSGLPTTY